MQTFDYTEEGSISGEVYDAIAKMRGHELAKVYDAIKNIKEEEQKQREEQLQEWFDITLLPVLKEVAQSVDAVFEIQSDQLSMENMGEELWFTLVYKKEHLVK